MNYFKVNIEEDSIFFIIPSITLNIHRLGITIISIL